VSFFRTATDPRLTPPALTVGVLKSVRLFRQDDLFTVTLVAAAPIRLEASPVGDAALNLRVLLARPNAVAAALVKRDVPQHTDRDQSADDFEVVRLKYADVSEVAGLLSRSAAVNPNDSFKPTEPPFGANLGGSASYRPVPTQAPPTDARGQPLAQAVDDTVAIDRRLNAIILRGPRERIERLKRQIALVDAPAGSVVLETSFYELDRTGAQNLGFNLNNPGSRIAVSAFQLGNAPPGVPTSRVSLQAALSAQVSQGHGAIVTKPSIAALSGSPAMIVTGEALPILTSIALSGVSAVSQQVRYVNIGVMLQVSPRISGDDFVISHVLCITSYVTGSSNGFPTVSQREVSTSVTVRNGESFVIGGLTEASELKSSGPWIAGAAVQTQTSTNANTELYIVVTPYIGRNPRSGPRAAF
jgi:general secretion pathway protein D